MLYACWSLKSAVPAADQHMHVRRQAHEGTVLRLPMFEISNAHMQQKNAGIAQGCVQKGTQM